MDLSVGRLLTLLELLQAHRRLSASEIASRLEVDRRTVRRYVAGLQEMGIPVEGERGRAGGYRLRPGYKLPPLMFTDEEAVALVLGLLAVQRLGLVRGRAARDLRPAGRIRRGGPCPAGDGPHPLRDHGRDTARRLTGRSPQADPSCPGDARARQGWRPPPPWRRGAGVDRPFPGRP